MKRPPLGLRSALRRARIRHASPLSLPTGFDRVWHYHVRKTAGSSLDSAFWALAGVADMAERRTLVDNARRRPIEVGPYRFVAGATKRFFANEGTFHYGSSHRPAERLALANRTFTVTILRDPARRLVSYYRYLHYLIEHGMADGPDEEELAPARVPFPDFVDQIPRERLETQLWMFSTSFDVTAAVDRISACDTVMFTETYASDLAALAERLGLDLQVFNERAFAYSTTVSPDQIAAVRPLLDAEYEFVTRVIDRLRPDVAPLVLPHGYG